MGWNPFSRNKTGASAAKAQTRPKVPPVPDAATLEREAAAATARDDMPDEAFVRAAIDAAKQELDQREQASRRRARSAPSAPVSGDPSATKRELIHAAMTVHRLKQSALDDLTPQQREQLRGMAENMLGVGSAKKK